MFRQHNRMASVRPQNGQQVLIKARISVYEPGGDYQLLARAAGRCRAAVHCSCQFEQTKARLLQMACWRLRSQAPFACPDPAPGPSSPSPTRAAIRGYFNGVAAPGLLAWK